MSVFLGNRGTKIYKLEDENIASKFIKRGTNKENVWEHGNLGQFWKGTREQRPPLETLNCMEFLCNFYAVTLNKFLFLMNTELKHFKQATLKPSTPSKSSTSRKQSIETPGGTPLFELYEYVPLDRVWFFLASLS